MKAAEFLATAKELPTRSLLDAITGGIVIIAPHPDDESVGCGGLICQASDYRVPLRIVFLSDGTGSHPNSASYPPAKLRQLRHEEGIRACARLGVRRENLLFLNLQDRFVPTQGPLADWAISMIRAQIDEIQATSVFVTWDQDPHCDHVAAFALARKATGRCEGVQLYAYPTWAWLAARTPEIGYPPAGFRLPVMGELGRKWAAVMEHKSQTTDLIDDDPGAFRLPPSFLDAMLQPYEVFLEAPLS